MQINDILPGMTTPWIPAERCPHNETAFTGDVLWWCEACGTVLNPAPSAVEDFVF